MRGGGEGVCSWELPPSGRHSSPLALAAPPACPPSFPLRPGAACTPLCGLLYPSIFPTPNSHGPDCSPDSMAAQPGSGDSSLEMQRDWPRAAGSWPKLEALPLTGHSPGGAGAVQL